MTQFLIDSLKSKCAPLSGSKKRLILFGAPGSGKGTHSEWMEKEWGLLHISTGDALREAVQAQTPLGLECKAIMDRGDLVSDEIVLKIVEAKLTGIPESCGGWVLDGFPRTVQQAEGLDALLDRIGQPLNGVINFHCEDDTLVRRVCGRRVHLKSGRTYHVEFKPPRVADVDDETGEPLIQRKDDNAESMKTRLENFKKQTFPLLEYYGKRDIVFHINGEHSPARVKKDVQLLVEIAGLSN